MTSATFRLPGPLAIPVAQVDQMSGGRVELGLGAGWFEEEHTAYGIPFPPLGERFDRLEEQLAVITGLWATPAGETLRLRRQALPGRRLARAAQAGAAAPPAGAASAATGPSAPRGWPPGTPTSSTCRSPRWRTPRPVRPGPRGLRRDRPRPGDADAGPTRSVLCCGRDDAEVARRAAAIGREPDELRANGLAGTPAEVVDTIGRYAEVGSAADLPPGARPGRPGPPGAGRRRGDAAAVTPGPHRPAPPVGRAEAGRPEGAAGGQRGRAILPGSRSTVSNRPSRSLSR